MPEESDNASAMTRLGSVIRAELAFYPGRASLITRIVLACTITMVLIMIFRIPGAALGAYYPLLLSRDSPRSTRHSAVRTGIICVIATAEIIFGAMLFAGSPFLHFFWVAGNLFGVFYLISSLTIYDSALAVGLLVTNAITTWDQPLSSGMRVSQTLYTLLSILLGCAVSVAVEYFLAQTHPTDAVLEGIQQRLSAVGTLLAGYADGQQSLLPQRSQLAKLALKGTGHLRDRLAHSSYENRYKERLGAALALSGRVVELAAALADLSPPSSQEARIRCAHIRAEIDAIDESLTREEAPSWIARAESPGLDSPLLLEIERTVELIAQSLTDERAPIRHHLPEPGEEPQLPSFAADAFTSRRHLRFAIRGTLSALACYLLYMSVGWTGLSASIATCILTALTSTGASRHKQLMRFAGVIVGACILGFGTQAILLPQIDSLFSFSLLFAAVIAFGAWVGTSGPRLAYLGAQIVLAYDLVNLNRFTIATSLVPARDTVLGIVLGIVAMWLIFDHLWASPTSDLTRTIFLTSFQDIAALSIPPQPVSAPAELERLLGECDRIIHRLDRLRSLVDFSVFEAYPKPPEETYLSQCVTTLQPQLRSILLLKAGLLEQNLVAPQSEASEVIGSVQEICSAMLLSTSSAIASAEPEDADAAADLPGICAAVKHTMQRARAAGDAQIVSEMRLCASLLDLVRHVQISACSIVQTESQAAQSTLPPAATASPCTE